MHQNHTLATTVSLGRGLPCIVITCLAKYAEYYTLLFKENICHQIVVKPWILSYT